MDEINNKAVGQKIRSIRKEKGMTTEEFAVIFDQPASKGTVSKWENGHYLPNNERLVTIAELGNTTVDELLYGGKLMKKVYVAMDTLEDCSITGEPHVLGVFDTEEAAEQRIKDYISENEGEDGYESVADCTTVIESEYFQGV